MLFLVGSIAFISEYLDSGLGMGYGTVLAPILIILGYSPLQVVPAILISQLATDIAACVSHHRCRNVDFNFNSQDLRVALLLGLVSSVGVVIAVIVAFKIPKWLLTLYIGLLVTVMGLFILFTIKRPVKFSWPKITGISFLAAFNKGVSGGGYGPLVMGGQMLSGVHVKNSVGITAFAEAMACLVGFVIYLIMGKALDWKLIGLLLISALPAVPLAALTVKNVNAIRLKRLVGIFITLLGLLTLLKIALGT